LTATQSRTSDGGRAAGALHIIAGLHLLPDAWAGARAARIWPALMCLSPLTGTAASAFPVLAAAGPVLLALAAGVLAQTVRVSLRSAFRGLRTSRLLLSRPAMAATIAAIVAAMAEYAVG
jgi:hypothetical protein